MHAIKYIFMFIVMTSNTFAVSKVDLYNFFFSVKSSTRCDNNKKCSMLKKNLNSDSNRCVSNPKKVKSIINYNRGSVSGRLTYLGFVPVKYGYDILSDGRGGAILESRVYIRNTGSYTKRELDRLSAGLRRAAHVWTVNNSLTDFHLTFRFKLTNNERKAHVKPRLLRKKTRGPYFAKWSTQWDDDTLAHEMGHVMGLNDEYHNTLFPKAGSHDDCSISSLMCAANWGRPQPFHYYLILNRLVCRQ